MGDARCHSRYDDQPYLFFWQASQEVEEEKGMGRLQTVRLGASASEIINRKLDVGVGTFFSNLVMFFIIVTTALTLHQHGITNIETSRQAAEALRPLAGPGCFFLYTIGIIGVGCLRSRRCPGPPPTRSPRRSAGNKVSMRSWNGRARSMRSCCSPPR